MAECSIYPNLSDQQQFRPIKINKIKYYFVAEIKETELMSKRLSKYITSFGSFDNSLIVLSVTTGSISIASFAAIIGASVGMASASFSLTFLISKGIVKKLLKTTRSKKKRHNEIVMLAKSKLDSIESKISEALINKIVNKILLAGDKFIPQMHLKQPGFTYSTCGPFTKNKERIQKFKETEDSRYVYKNGLDKACFQHDTAYGDFKDLAKRTVSDKILRDKAFKIASNPKYDGYQRYCFYGL